MRAILGAILVVLLGISGAEAGVREALDAYQKGDFGGAVVACRGPAEQADASCQNLMGVLFSEGRGVPKNDSEAAQWFRKAAEQGHGHACFNLGRAYQFGDGVKQSNEEAAKWYRKAAELRVPEGELGLGALIIMVDRNYREGLKWVRKAARQGLPTAEGMLGIAYEHGLGMKENPRTAVKWYLLGANHGDPTSQNNLAALYEEGKGLERDPTEAYFWYVVASRNPATPQNERKIADNGAKRLSAKLTRDQLASADDAVRKFNSGSAAAIRLPPRNGSKAATAGGPRLYATGSGFFVTTSGHLLTNNHVVADCGEVKVTEGEHSTPAKVLATDPDLDLALVQLPHAVPTAVVFRENAPRLGENVVVMGFPLSGLLTSDAVVTTGIVSALAGMRDDRHKLQISAPVQPGNSGGPLLDPAGHLVGVVVSKLDGMRVASLTGAIPENVNFAIKGEDARSFLRAHNVGVVTAPSGKDLSTDVIAEQGLRYTVRLECWK
ncbi:MAG TPA: tetratricopeptide repeat-containing serine protease family protein [Stellaceae bacterium]|nr:tetratricopeptide repeat-containing serine protease family protein [Stellaceae bacterium]